MVFETEVVDGILKMNCLGSIFGFTMEDSDIIMARVVEKLIEEKKVVGIVLAETREYEYDSEQTEMLAEVADLITSVVKEEKLLSIKNIAVEPCTKFIPEWYGWLRDLVTLQLRGDPIGAYLNLIREIRHLKTKMTSSEEYKDCIAYYIQNALLPLQENLENCSLIRKAKPYISGYHIGDRTLYRKFFKPTIRPNFMYTKFMAQPPIGGETVAKYKLGDTDIEIFKVPGKVRYVYHVIPPEFKLDEDEYTLLDAARRVLEQRRPRELEIEGQEKMRELFHTLSLDLLRDLSEQMGKTFEAGQMERLADILTRYTAGLGVIEILLKDSKIQDIFINSPLGNLPIFIYHQDYEECETNLMPTLQDGDRWATRFKLISGRPLDEANPVLDTEVTVPDGVARVAAINPRLSPEGLGFALRRHRFKPWTFPLFLKEKYFNPLFGGLMWFIASYGRTVLIAGSRGSGKCMDGATLIQITDGSIKTIKDIVEASFEKDGSIECEDGLYSFTNSLNILTLDEDCKIKPARVTCVWKRKAPERLVKITTKTGKSILTTPEHPYFVLEDGKIKHINAEKLEKDKRIATPKILDACTTKQKFLLSGLESDIYVDQSFNRGVFPNSGAVKEISTRLDLSRGCVEKWVKGGSIPLQKLKLITDVDKISIKNLTGKTTALPIKFIEEMTGDVATFLGYLLGDGSIDSAGVQFHNSDVNMRKRFLDLGKQIFDLNGREEFPRNRTQKAVLQSKVLSKLLNDLFKIPIGKKADKIEVPESILKSSRNVQTAFIKAYFDCDASVGRGISVSSASEKMIRQMQLLLTRYEIVSFFRTKKVKNKDYFELNIYSDSVEKYASNIGFNLEKKQAELLRLLDDRKYKIKNTLTDTIPHCGKLLKLIRETLRVSQKEVRYSIGKGPWAYENEIYLPSLRWFKKIVEFYNQKLNERKALLEKIELLEKFEKYEVCNKIARELIEELNIRNDEILGEVCLQTVSNFKNRTYKMRKSTLQKICRAIIKIYRNVFNSEIDNLMERVNLIANSEIFWDKIVKVEFVEPKEKWVYDLTIEPTHSFVANGIIAHNTSFLGSFMLQILPYYRIITSEDTFELPIEQMRNLGYNIERMKSRSVITRVELELPAEEVIRTALRLGDSCLIVGEIRSLESRALFEAMRIGAMANTVAGTVHGESAYGVFDRIVNDLGVPPTSFKAVDFIVVCNKLKTPDGLRTFRRVTELTEVRKHWKKDPMDEAGFVNLMEHRSAEDRLVPTDTLLNGESYVLNEIASRVPGWSGRWDYVWDNIQLRAKILETILDIANKTAKPDLLEAESTVEANQMFHIFSEKCREDIGSIDSKRVYNEWLEWFKNYSK